MTEMLRRDIPPQTKTFEHFNFPGPVLAETPYGVPLYIVSGEKHEVLRVDILFKRGAYNQTLPLQASSSAAIASEATEHYSSARLSELVDFYGGWIQRAVYMHATLFTLYAPKRNFSKLLALFVEVLSRPRFSRRDLTLYKERGRSEYKQMYERVDFIAAQSLRKLLYTTHPYGTTAKADDFDNLTIPLLKEYHQKTCIRKNSMAILSGNIDDKTVEQTIDALAALPEPPEKEAEEAIYPLHDSTDRFVHDEKEDALQCSVRIGGIIKKETKSDNPELSILNTLLGGYFGSRLMTNIREEKGYTYGIGSSITPLRYATSINIAAQCDLKYAGSLIKEVISEINKIKEIPVKAEEIESVRQYMLGEMNRIFDSRFTFADACLSMLINEQPFDYINRKAATLLTITPEQIMATARKYLHPDKMHVAVAGGDKQFGYKISQTLKE